MGAKSPAFRMKQEAAVHEARIKVGDNPLEQRRCAECHVGDNPILGFRGQVRYECSILKTLGTQAHDAFCSLLKQLRTDRNLTQLQLAERLALPQSYVSKYETGERRLDFIETAELCDALGLGLDKFAALFLRKLEGQNARAKPPVPRKRK